MKIIHNPRASAFIRFVTVLVSSVALLTFTASVLGNTVKPVAVQPKLETPANFDDDQGGNADADDPAIWVHPLFPSKSLVFATLKDAGLAIYNLQGKLIQSISAPLPPASGDRPGRFNNVDLAYGFALQGKRIDLAVVSDRGSDKLRIYAINPRTQYGNLPPLTDVTTQDAPFIFSRSQLEVNQQTTAYGVAVYRDPGSGRTFAYVSQRNRTAIALIEILPTVHGKISYVKRREITLPSQFKLPNGTKWTPCTDPGELPQVEGMVVDRELGWLYAAQEDVGVWKLSLNLTALPPVLIDRVREYGVPYTYDASEEQCNLNFKADPGYGGKHLSADAEGLTIYYANCSQGYLLVSSQGDNTFAIYNRRGNNPYIGSFSLVDAPGVDGVQESDGADVVNVPLNRDFPLGLLVTHDGHNKPERFDDEGEDRDNTNFKFTPWESIAQSFPNNLLINPSYPRR